jgi:hypothetical protein
LFILNIVNLNKKKMKKIFWTIFCLALLIGWVVALLTLHDEGFLRTALMIMGLWSICRFFFRGKWKNGFGKWWDISVSLVEVAGIAIVIGILDVLAVGISNIPTGIKGLFGGNSQPLFDLSRMWWVVFELEAPAFAGLILGLTFKNKKRQ